MAASRITTRKKLTEMAEPIETEEVEYSSFQPIQKRSGMNWTPVMVILLLVSAYLLGMLTTKVQLLGSTTSYGSGTTTTPTTGTNNQQPAAAGAAVGPLHVAKAIGMDVTKFNSCLESGKYKQKVLDDNTYANKVGVQATPANFINGTLVLGAVPYATLKTTIDQELQSASAENNQFNVLSLLGVKSAFAQTTDTPTPAAKVDVQVGDFPVMGNPNAKVTYIEFADFQCPFCKQFFTQTEQQIINDYVKTGKVKFVFRNFAFLGADSNTSAEGAYCANDQGKFWDYHNFLYSHQAAEGSGQFSLKNLE